MKVASADDLDLGEILRTGDRIVIGHVRWT